MTRSDQIRLRQIALIAKDVKATQRTIEAAFGIPLVWKDPGLGPPFGLENILFAFSGNVLEVCSPIKQGTTVGRLLERRGDGGYMLIFHVPDAAADRKRVKALGIRSVWEADRPHYTFTHFHPNDLLQVGGIPSLDSTPKLDDLLKEYSPWPPIFDETEGPSKWLDIAKSKAVSRLSFQSVTVQSQENPHMVAVWWGRFLDLPVKLDSTGTSVINAMNMSIKFIQAPKSEANGIACIDIGVDGGDAAVKEAFERACKAPGAERGSFGGQSAVKMVGVWWRFEQSRSSSKAKI
ncbi:hypothetical protein M427DRAFT_138154 [Gonapodya prolifera JEL478]|uniref:Glyoxalase-like domain-containing protein n=1 Tax=Gonapodya prolifera (strain JEL478) TaxID=1344416 RepID=A0A139A411_GONPJ|nr:hypothetical protein M427DRAFT_138154 [Gonapodya prolifera JEL478]|eukprot:KXS11566.1 hypothetical protein M427DRAFT_138154 [Gonapodya prolifera JEL478]